MVAMLGLAFVLELVLKLGVLNFRSPAPFRASQQLGQLRKVRSDPPCLVFGEQLGSLIGHWARPRN
jgi:hypothetical protein